MTGKYRGSAQSNCNNDLELTNKVPIIFHDLKIMMNI